MRRADLVAYLFSFIGFAFCSTASASLLIVEDEAAWVALAGGVTGTEDFESFTVDTEFRSAPLQIQGMRVTAGATISNPTTNIIDVPPLVLSGFEDINGTVTLAGNMDGSSGIPTSVTFFFDIPLTAWGTTIRGLSGSNSPFELFDKDGLSLGIFFQTPTTAVSFIGFAFDDGRAASRMEISHTGGSNDFFRMDNIAFVTSIPEPGSLAILVTGLLGLVFFGRRSRQIERGNRHRSRNIGV